MTKLAASLLVPSVQELAEQPINEVPERYLRQNQDLHVVSNTSSVSQIPVIDFDKLLSQDVTELEKLDHVCKEWGFFQLINHGVNPSLVENMKKGVKEFFDLPMEEKKQFWQTPDDMEGFGQFVVSQDQKLDWAYKFDITTLPTRNPRLFPSIPQPLRDNAENYSMEMKKLCNKILGLMATALKIEPNELLELFDDLNQITRWIYYPPCPHPENVTGNSPHSDSSTLVILLQANEVEGLQIKKDGKWIPVKPLSDAFVINIGDTLEILTNGIYGSIVHRVTVNKEKERISIAIAHKPQMNRVIGPSPGLVTRETPALFKNITVQEYLKLYYSHDLEEKLGLDAVRIQNVNGK